MIDLLKPAQAKGLRPRGVLLNLGQLHRIRKPAIAFMKPGHYVVGTGSDAGSVSSPMSRR